MSRTLITGFGPFREVDENPSALLAGLLGRPHEILEVSYAAVDTFIENFDALSFDNILLMGVATGRSHVSLELVAHNIKSGNDVTGASAHGLIEQDGPEIMNSTMWSRELVEFLKIQYPTDLELSWNAGDYLCNYIYYKALRHLSVRRIGFLHVASVELIPLRKQEEIVGAILSELIG